MCTIEKLTTENGIQVSVNSSYAIDVRYNAIYNHLFVTRIALDQGCVVITGQLWASGGSRYLADLPPRISPHPKMLVKTNLEKTVKPHQILSSIEVVSQAEFETIPEDLRQPIFFATHSKAGRSFKKILPQEFDSGTSSTRQQLGIILRKGIRKLVRLKSGCKGSFSIDTQNLREAFHLIQTAGT